MRTSGKQKFLCHRPKTNYLTFKFQLIEKQTNKQTIEQPIYFLMNFMIYFKIYTLLIQI